MSEPMSAAEIADVIAVHSQQWYGEGYLCGPCNSATLGRCLPYRLAETALSILGDQPAPEQPTHHTNDCDLLIRHRACSCGYAPNPFLRSADA